MYLIICRASQTSGWREIQSECPETNRDHWLLFWAEPGAARLPGRGDPGRLHHQAVRGHSAGPVRVLASQHPPFSHGKDKLCILKVRVRYHVQDCALWYKLFLDKCCSAATSHNWQICRPKQNLHFRKAAMVWRIFSSVILTFYIKTFLGNDGENCFCYRVHRVQPRYCAMTLFQ